MSTTASDAAAGCYAGGSAYPFPYRGSAQQPTQLMPACRYANAASATATRIVDEPLAAVALGARKPYNPFGAGYRGGKANVPAGGLAGGQPVPIADSFGVPFLWVRQDSAGCFSFFNEADGGAGADADLVAQNCVGQDATALQLTVQGLGCMATTALTDSYALVIFNTDQALSPPGKGTLGFMRLGALAGLAAGSAQALHDSYPGDRDPTTDAPLGCGRPADFRQTPTQTTPGAYAVGAFAPNEVYLNSSTYDSSCLLPGGCQQGGPLGNYSTGLNADVVYLTSSTTGVSNAQGLGPPTVPSGVVRAIVRRESAFAAYQAMPYSDPNVPCSQDDIARWVWGDANPGAGGQNDHIFAWMPYRADDRANTCAPPAGDSVTGVLASAPLAAAPAS